MNAFTRFGLDLFCNTLDALILIREESIPALNTGQTQTGKKFICLCPSVPSDVKVEGNRLTQFVFDYISLDKNDFLIQ